MSGQHKAIKSKIERRDIPLSPAVQDKMVASHGFQPALPLGKNRRSGPPSDPAHFHLHLRIAGRHFPLHAAHEKETPFEDAKNGISGLDTALASLWELVRQGRLTAEDIATRFAWRPAAIFGLPANRFSPGDPADFLLFDPDDSWIVTAEALRSKGKNTPLMGQPLTGRVVLTAVGGEIVHDLGRLAGA